MKQGLPGTLNLAQFVSVRGTLSDPKIGIDEKEALTGAISMGAAAATGGLSMVGQSLLKTPTDPHPCATALTGKPAAGKQAAPTPADPSSILKGLFGKR